MPRAPASSAAIARGSSGRIRARLGRIDWAAVEAELDERGYAVLPKFLDATESGEIVRLYAQPKRFRSFVDLGRHRFGEGDYRYFARPLPGLIRALRYGLYPRLAPIANRWQQALGRAERYPPRLSAFLARCLEHQQIRPTPLVLHYPTGGYNCLHQDVYGAIAFPLQLACLLSKPDLDFEGGEFLVTEQRPRMQSRGEAIRLERGDAILFANRERPVSGGRGTTRALMRHGVSRVRSGERFALGIIFHDAA